MVEADQSKTAAATTKPKIDWHEEDDDSDYDDEDGPMIGDDNNSSAAKPVTPAKAQQSDANDGT